MHFCLPERKISKVRKLCGKVLAMRSISYLFPALYTHASAAYNIPSFPFPFSLLLRYNLKNLNIFSV